MEKSCNLLLRAVSVLLAACLAGTLISCENLKGDYQTGTLNVRFARGQFQTKAAVEIPDTNDFMIFIRDGDGKEVYGGRFGDVPEFLEVRAGSYDISVRSSEFTVPEFDRPVYGDDQCVVVPSGGVERVDMLCSQINSGVRLKVEPNFLTAFPEGVLFLKSTDGRLMYSYSERRIAYFKPGEVSLLIDDGGEQSNLLTRSLEPKEILTVGISAPAPDSHEGGIGGIHISIDTARVWTGAGVAIGDQGGEIPDDAMDVATARKCAGQKDVWVYGYIVGSFKSTNHIQFESPYPTATNLAISGKTSASTTDSCLSVELKKGTMRDELNLVEHPENRGKKVFFKGDLTEAYYGIPGIKNITDYAIR